MILQLNPPLPMVCPKGSGWAHFLLCESIEHNAIWVIFLDDTNEIWFYENPHVRADKNITLGRDKFSNKELINKLQGIINELASSSNGKCNLSM